MAKPKKPLKQKKVPVNSKKKRKKKRDKFCGLNQSLVLSATPSNVIKQDNSRISNIINLDDSESDWDLSHAKKKKFTIKMKENSATKVLKVIKKDVKKHMKNSKKQKKNLSKLNELLNNSVMVNKKPVSKLANFLESLNK